MGGKSSHKRHASGDADRPRASRSRNREPSRTPRSTGATRRYGEAHGAVHELVLAGPDVLSDAPLPGGAAGLMDLTANPITAHYLRLLSVGA